MDVTALTRSGIDLVLGEVLMRTVADNTSVGLVVLDRNHRYTFVNRAYVDLLGVPYTVEEMIGLGPAEILAPIYATRIAPNLDRAFAGERVTYEIERQDPRLPHPVHYSVVYDPLRGAGGSVDSVVATIFDITARKQAEAALAAANARYELVLAGAGVGIWDWDVVRRTVAYSPRWCELRGLEPGEVSDSEEVWSTGIHPDDRPRVMAAVQAHFAGVTPFYAEEYRVLRKDGTWLWIADRGIARRDESGRVVRMAGAETDITARKIVEERLRQSQYDLERAQAVARTGSWRLDVRLNELTWSPENHRIFGVPKGTPMTYETFLAIVHPDDRAGVDRAWKAALAGAPYDFEHRIVVGGRTRWVRERADLEFDASGNLLGGFGTTQDVTEKKRAEEELRDSRLSLQSALDVANLAAWGWDERARIKLWTPETKAIFGVAPDTEMTRELFVSMLHPDDVPRYEAAWAAAMDPGGAHVYELEYRIRRASDGAERWVSSRANIEFEDGKAVRVMGAMRDVTQTKRDADALRTSEERLKAVVDTAADAIIVIDAEGRIQSANPSVERIFGYAVGELVGNDVAMLMPSEQRASHRDRVAHYRAGEPTGQGREIVGLRKSGLTFPGELSVSAWSHGGQRFFTGVVRDISDRREAEAEKLAGEQRMRLATEATGVGIWEWNVLTNVLRWDAQMFRIYGIEPAEGGHCTYADWEAAVVPEQVAEQSALLRRLAREGGVHQRSFRIRRKDTGECRDILAVETVRRNGAGITEWVVGTNLDVTERRRAEEQTKLLMTEVNHRAKNLLAVVQSVALHTAGEEDPRLFAERFAERLEGLAASHDLLVKSQWKGVDADELARSQLSHFADLIGSRLIIDGPAVLLLPQASQAIGMAILELATNAAKHGALSTHEGVIRLAWGFVDSSPGASFHMSWRERGGPPVRAPTRKGFGHTVIVDMVEHALDAKVAIDYLPAGLQWTFEAPRERVIIERAGMEL